MCLRNPCLTKNVFHCIYFTLVLLPKYVFRNIVFTANVLFLKPLKKNPVGNLTFVNCLSLDEKQAVLQVFHQELMWGIEFGLVRQKQKRSRFSVNAAKSSSRLESYNHLQGQYC